MVRQIVKNTTIIVTVDPGSKPDQKHARRRDRQKYVTRIKYNLGLAVKGFILCAVHWYVAKLWASWLLVLSS